MIALLLILLAPVVAADIIPSTKTLKKEHDAKVEAELSDAFKSVKEHVQEMREELRDSLKEKGVAFKTGLKEGATDERHSFSSHYKYA